MLSAYETKFVPIFNSGDAWDVREGVCKTVTNLNSKLSAKLTLESGLGVG